MMEGDFWWQNDITDTFGTLPSIALPDGAGGLEHLINGNFGWEAVSALAS